MSGQTTITRLLPDDYTSTELRSDVRRGLSALPKWLPPKWFYDARGSQLFEEITQLPEYYQTRTEHALLRERAAAVAALTGANTLVELGSGSSTKTRLLLDALRDAGTLRRYVPVDVSETALRAAGDALREDYPTLAVHAVVSDFEAHLGLPDPDGGRQLVAFLGGTIGNLVPEERLRFLRRVRAGLGPDDALLLGTDLVKDADALVRAYDDASGVTAAFNKNVLAVINRELEADFDLDAYDHMAVWVPTAEWIEMRLRSRIAQQVKIRALDLSVSFDRGEEMRTEISAKFREATVRQELMDAGLNLHSWWTDPNQLFAISLSTPL